MQDAQQAAYDGPKARVAVSHFSGQAIQEYGRAGRSLSDMLATALFNTNRFIVVEREKIGEVLAEQDLGTSGRVSKKTRARSGDIEGAELMVTGSVTEFEPGASGANGGLGLPSIISSLTGGIKKSHIAIDMRVIDARTSRLVAAITVEGSATDVGGAIDGVVPVGSVALPASFGGWSNTPMEGAIRTCIQKAVDSIVERTPRTYYHFK
jgi:curli biogenesis system outer membrane secretion channel CsgG